MEPLVKIEGIAAPLPIDNVDTDAIIPSRETQSVARTGYDVKLFANWRYEPGTRIDKPDFVLNREPYTQARVLVAGTNFGCGSSREAAVWSLQQFGIRAVIAASFGAIFYNNCIRNSTLPVVLEQEQVADVFAFIEQHADQPIVTVDLEHCCVTAGKSTFSFNIDPRDREMLMSGADEVELTLRNKPAIDEFKAVDSKVRPWLYQQRPNSENR